MNKILTIVTVAAMLISAPAFAKKAPHAEHQTQTYSQSSETGTAPDFQDMWKND